MVRDQRVGLRRDSLPPIRLLPGLDEDGSSDKLESEAVDVGPPPLLFGPDFRL
jgi:hypothetical protein